MRDARDMSDVRPPAHKTRIIGAYGGFRKTISFAYVCLVYHATTGCCSRAGACASLRDRLRRPVLRFASAHSRSAASRFSTPFSYLPRMEVFKGATAMPRDMTEYVHDSKNIFPSDRGERMKLAKRRLFRGAGQPSEARQPKAARAARLGVSYATSDRFSLKTLKNQFLNAKNAKTGDAKNAKSLCDLCVKRLCGLCVEKQPRRRKMVARKGRNAGQPFWSCRNYPNCKGSRPWGRSRWAE